MDGSFWYYSLSTISQTLAAIVALSATFIIFKLDILQKKRLNYINEMMRFLMILNPGKENHEIDRLNDTGILGLLIPIIDLNPNKPDLGFGEKQYKKLLKERQREIDNIRSVEKLNPKRLYYYLLERKEDFTKMTNVKRNAYLRLRCSLLLISISILVSIILLPFYEIIKNNNITFIICLLVILLASLSVIYTGFSIWKIASDDYFKIEKK